MNKKQNLRKKGFLIACLTGLVCTAAMAQQTDVIELTRGNLTFNFMNMKTERKVKGKTIAEWPANEVAYITDSCVVKKVTILKNLDDILPRNYSIPNEEGITAAGWRLNVEGDETVLHCYLRMPADIVTNLWLAHEETTIMDMETGVRYQARRTSPAECWRKHFTVNAKKGDFVDFCIYFPKLPETTSRITIFGVPNWNLRGNTTITMLNRRNMDNGNPDMWLRQYDTIPKFRQPRQVKQESNYNKSDYDSWAAYTDPHLIKPVGEKTMALWLTPKATYLAMVAEHNWIREYFNIERGTFLIDNYGHQYKLREVQGLPMEHIFWMEGYPGDFFAMVLEFEPVPLGIPSIHYIQPEGEAFEAWGANWSGDLRSDLNVEQMRRNQSLFKYHPREVVK